jgi:RNA polymerase sigma factor (sigma-70 family)
MTTAEQLYASHERLAVKTRNHVVPAVPTRIDPEDLDQEARIALWLAAQRFDPERGTKFASYGIGQMRGAMLESLRKEDWVPRSVRTKQKVLLRAANALTVRLGREPTEAELAEFLALSIDELKTLQKEALTLRQVAFEDVVGDPEHDDLDPLMVADSVSDPTPLPDEAAIWRVEKEDLHRTLSWLPSPEREVLSLYYLEGWTLKQIATHRGRSESRAHQLHAQGMRRLRGFLGVPEPPPREQRPKTPQPPAVHPPPAGRPRKVYGSIVDRALAALERQEAPKLTRITIKEFNDVSAAVPRVAHGPGRNAPVQTAFLAALEARGLKVGDPIGKATLEEIGAEIGRTGGTLSAHLSLLRKKAEVPPTRVYAARKSPRKDEEAARVLRVIEVQGIDIRAPLTKEETAALVEATGLDLWAMRHRLSQIRKAQGIRLDPCFSEKARPAAPLPSPASAPAPTPGLCLSPDLTLPVDAVTETFAILGKRGAGKTTAASVLVEELHRHGGRFVIVDPLGVWWGLRSSADGEGDGLKVPILGGEHGDLPLDPEEGAAVAASLWTSAILDLSDWRKEDQQRFVGEFCERLRQINREPLMLVVDEADLFAAQSAGGNGIASRCRSALDDLVRRGRTRGLGVTLLTQRSAVISKSVLSQCETLLALRTAGPNDRAAIDAWVDAHGDEEQRRELAASLPSLAVGEAWVASAGWLSLFKRIKIRRRSTWDSSATPKAGEEREGPSAFARVDVEALRDRLRPPAGEPEEGPDPLPAMESGDARALVEEALARGGGILWGEEKERIAQATGLGPCSLVAMAREVRSETNGDAAHALEATGGEEVAAAALLFAATGETPVDWSSWPLRKRAALMARGIGAIRGVIG